MYWWQKRWARPVYLVLIYAVIFSSLAPGMAIPSPAGTPAFAAPSHNIDSSQATHAEELFNDQPHQSSLQQSAALTSTVVITLTDASMLPNVVTISTGSQVIFRNTGTVARQVCLSDQPDPCAPTPTSTATADTATATSTPNAPELTATAGGATLTPTTTPTDTTIPGSSPSPTPSDQPDLVEDPFTIYLPLVNRAASTAAADAHTICWP
ncbi:MAG: hypothetical protein HC876_00220 [Chloroflexaceae bacterium]|nr:hypothetical protein [Chloroflexaceae bacterium]